MARAGIASRRQSEEIIAAGRVKVNGKIVQEMGTKIDPAIDQVEVDGEEIEREKLRYFKLHKPVGVISSASDPQGRKTVVDYVNHIPQRLYPVGRLDYNSRGLILLTNDGRLTNILTHPSFEITKTYQVLIAKILAAEDLKKLEQGVRLKDGLTAPARVSSVSFTEGNTTFMFTIREGRKRQIRRMVATLGYEVLDLKRIKMGPIRLKDLKPGKVQEITGVELEKLLSLKDRYGSTSK